MPRLTGYEKQFPTWGDLAREQLRRRGIPYFADVQTAIQTRLEKMSPDARKAFALACAERLMRRHERLPKPRPFTMSWRPLLDVMWLSLERRSEEAHDRVDAALRAFHESPFDHDDGPDGPDDADEDAAAASIYASECFLSGDAQNAGWSASRALDWAFAEATEELQLDPNEFTWDPAAEPMPLAREAMHTTVQQELHTQLADLDRLENDGITGDVIRFLKR